MTINLEEVVTIDHHDGKSVVTHTVKLWEELPMRPSLRLAIRILDLRTRRIAESMSKDPNDVSHLHRFGAK